jgi:3',5'-cyclic-AMP phosphodiesterase
MCAKIVQITDLHLFEDPAGELLGVNTRDSFGAVMADVERRHGDADLLVISGDIAQDEAFPTYVALREALGENWSKRCRLIPGNHDNRAAMRAAFATDLFTPGVEWLGFAVSVDGWQVVGVDSQLTGEINGRVASVQLDWLDSQLAANTSTLMFIHHPPFAIGVPRLDKYGLYDVDAFTNLIGRHSNVRAVCAGHVHQEAHARFGATAFYTSPSTCVQFGNGQGPDTSPTGYGYRVVQLNANNTVETEIYRV